MHRAPGLAIADHRTCLNSGFRTASTADRCNKMMTSAVQCRGLTAAPAGRQTRVSRNARYEGKQEGKGEPRVSAASNPALGAASSGRCLRRARSCVPADHTPTAAAAAARRPPAQAARPRTVSVRAAAQRETDPKKRIVITGM